MENNKIDCKYLFCILFLSRLLSYFLILGTVWTDTDPGDKITALFIGYILSLIACVPTVIFLNTGKNESLIIRAKAVSSVFAKITAVIYAVFFLAVCILTCQKFDLFSTSVMSPSFSQFLISATVIICAGYGAYHGLKVISRASVIITGFVVISIVFIFCTLLNKIDFNNLTPPFYRGCTPAIRYAFYYLCVTAEIPAIVSCVSEIKGKTVKNMYIWISTVFIGIFLIGFLVATVQGKFSDTRLFPIYSVIIQAGFGIFKRMDAIQTGIWTTCFLVKLCFYIFLTCKYIQEAFNIKNRLPVIAGTVAVIIVTTSLTSDSLLSIMASDNIILPLSVFLAVSVLLPVSIPIAEKIKTGRTKKTSL